MSTESFRRHTRVCLDAAIHRVCASLRDRPAVHAAFLQLLAVARARSDLLRAPPDRAGELVPVQALRNLARFHHEFSRAPHAWAGASGHPLAVVHALASHLFGRYPTPRFLASVWFGDDHRAGRERRRWFIAHARGRSVRTLRLPIAMTRSMAHAFLKTPVHLSVDHALRRAEVLGLGGSPAAADAILATRLGGAFDNAGFWRTVLEWLVRRADALDLAQVGPIIDYLQAVRHDRPRVCTPAGIVTRPPCQPAFSLSGRTLPSLMRLVAAWHATLGRATASGAWQPSRTHGLVYEVDPAGDGSRRVRWTIVELVDTDQLVREGQAMHHCVASYAFRCVKGVSAIWSLRRRGLGDGEDPARGGDGRSVLTIEVHPRTATIVQLRGPANQRAYGWPLELVRMWAARERLAIHRSC